MNIKDARYTKQMMGVKLYNTSYHVWALRPFKRGRFGRSKIQLSSKVAKFAGWIGIDLTLNFCPYDFFCAILNFSDMINFVFFSRDSAEI